MLHTVCNTTVTVVQVWYGLCCCHSYVYTTHARERTPAECRRACLLGVVTVPAVQHSVPTGQKVVRHERHLGRVCSRRVVLPAHLGSGGNQGDLRCSLCACMFLLSMMHMLTAAQAVAHIAGQPCGCTATHV
jgi:hypothetical protein